MVQDQLVEYISSQLRLGVSRDVIKTTLTTAGWQAADVEDTLKKVEAGTKSIVASPVTVAPIASSPASSPKTFEPQSIKVSDLISASPSSSMSTSTQPAPMKSVAVAAAVAAKPQVTMQPMSSFASREFPPKQKSGGSMMKIVAIVAVVLFAGLAGYFYWQNSGLAAKIATLNTQTASVAGNVGTLMDQVNALDASNTALTAQAGLLTTQNAELTTELSFVAVPPAGSGLTINLKNISITGTLTGGKSFSLMMAYGITAFVQNSKDASVTAALTPLLSATSTTVTLTGTHQLGSPNFTVTGVNGVSL